MPRYQLMQAGFQIARLRYCAAAALFLLTACGGGGGGGISIAGDNQSTDPATVEYPIAYIRRPAPTQPIPDKQLNDLRDPFAFHPGAKLLVRSRADADAVETNITDALFAGKEDLYDVKDLAVSPDGTQLVFALHAPLDRNLDIDDPDQPSWDIWIYNFKTKQINAVISSKNRSQGSDVAPQFLEDQRIVFVSNRQLKTRQQLSSSGSPAYSGLAEPPSNIKAGVLHIMDADGTHIDQISYNQSHDLSPAQLRNGKLVFTRWDNMSGNNRMDLYTINPSGMRLSYLYGYNSHNTGSDPAVTVQFSQPREMEDGRLVTIMRPYISPGMGGDLVAIDTAHFSDNAQPTWENSSVGGTAQQSLAANPVVIDTNPNPTAGTAKLSPGGEFGAVWPLFDGSGRLLIAWSQCRALDDAGKIIPCVSAPEGALPAPLIYGIWIFDPVAKTQKPIVTAQEGVLFTDIVAASPAKTITRAVDPTATGTNDLLDYGNNTYNNLLSSNLAVLDIRSVYNLDGGIGNFGAAAPAGLITTQANPMNTAAYQNRRARFLQIIQGVPLPDRNDEIPAANNQILRVPNFAFGQNGNYLRQIIGYVPIEADGSVALQVPADVPVTFNILDANAQRISTAQHKVWWQFRAGEVVRCTGCHNAQTPASVTLTHGRDDSAALDSNPGANGSGYFNGVSAGSVTLAGNRAGQSIAEIYAATNQQPRKPSVNVFFTDEYASVALKTADLDYRYTNTDPAHPHQVPVAPTTDACQANWIPSCRIVINYLEHIQPIWDKSRTVDATGNTLATDMQCTSCHGPVDAAALAQVPKGQLDLTSAPSDRDNDRVLSFSELFTQDIQQQLMGGAVVDVPDTIVNNSDGTTTTTQHTVAPVMSAGGSLNSARFFGCFKGGICGTSGETGFDHSNLLTKAELRLISEWLDIGGQYYNDVVKAAAAQ
ncbi:MAG: hypothetical protein JWM78_3211 [Verrucomicrobiaceae bacterium]|nr:hypothetical protein [Verrucomicrobiaceae bacterium]